MLMENRFKMLTKSHPDVAKRLAKEAQQEVTDRWAFYHHLASHKPDEVDGKPPCES